MPQKSEKNSLKQKLIQIVGLLKLITTLDDQEVVRSTLESVIEILEEEISE